MGFLRWFVDPPAQPGLHSGILLLNHDVFNILEIFYSLWEKKKQVLQLVTFLHIAEEIVQPFLTESVLFLIATTSFPFHLYAFEFSIHSASVKRSSRVLRGLSAKLADGWKKHRRVAHLFPLRALSDLLTAYILPGDISSVNTPQHKNVCLACAWSWV